MKQYTEIYPLTILKDRYGGIYSGGKYLAFNKHHDEIPNNVYGDDIACCEFWEDFCDVYGTGNTIENAIQELTEKIHDKELREKNAKVK